jgi:hypothetical protein
VDVPVPVDEVRRAAEPRLEGRELPPISSRTSSRGSVPRSARRRRNPKAGSRPPGASPWAPPGGVSAVSVRCSPMPIRLSSARRAPACRSQPGTFVITLVAEIRPVPASSRMPRLTPSDRPKSSAQRTRAFGSEEGWACRVGTSELPISEVHGLRRRQRGGSGRGRSEARCGRARTAWSFPPVGVRNKPPEERFPSMPLPLGGSRPEYVAGVMYMRKVHLLIAAALGASAFGAGPGSAAPVPSRSGADPRGPDRAGAAHGDPAGGGAQAGGDQSGSGAQAGCGQARGSAQACGDQSGGGAQAGGDASRRDPEVKPEG